MPYRNSSKLQIQSGSWFFSMVFMFGAATMTAYLLHRKHVITETKLKNGIKALSIIALHKCLLNVQKDYVKEYGDEVAHEMYPLPKNTTEAVLFLNTYIFASNTTFLLNYRNQGLGENKVVKHLITLRGPDNVNKLIDKLSAFLDRQQDPHLDIWEFNTLHYIEQTKDFWSAIVTWLGPVATTREATAVINCINARLPAMQRLYELSQQLSDRITNTKRDLTELYKEAHIAILDNDTASPLFEQSDYPTVKCTNYKSYTSAAALTKDKHIVKLWVLHKVSDAKTNGYIAKTLTANSPYHLPLKIVLQPLLPSEVSAEQVPQLQQIFDAAFTEQVSDIKAHQNFANGGFTTAIANMFWPNWGVKSKTIKDGAYTGNPKQQVCSSIVAQDIWKALEVVNAKLEELGYKQSIPNPFGENQRLDTLLPRDLVQKGFEKGWLVRVRDLELEKFVQLPKTPANGKERFIRKLKF